MSKAGSVVRYASRTTGVNFEKILTWGAIGVGLYLALETFGLLKSVASAGATAYTSARDAVASGLYNWFGPEEKFGDNTFFTVTFPNGQRHSIPKSSVSNQGVFRNQFTSDGSPYSYAGDGKTYQLVVEKGTRAYKAIAL